MTRRRHLSSLELLAAAFGDLGAKAPTHAGEERSCSACAAEIEDFRDLRDVLTHRADEPSEGVVLRAAALMSPSPGRAQVERFRLARLMHDSARFESRADVRGPASSRHQLWRTPGADIDLRMEGPSPGAAALLIGQVLPRRPAPAPRDGNAWLKEGKGHPRWAPISASGEFSLPKPSGRRWTLWIEWGALRATLRMS